jgi:hypothetical protein
MTFQVLALTLSAPVSPAEMSHSSAWVADRTLALLNARQGASQPFQIDRCHALRSDGEAVRQHYPRWHQPASPAAAPPAD